MMRTIDKKLHDAIHVNMMNSSPDEIFTHRVQIFKKIETVLDISISGTILDIGCGNGYASIWLAKNRNIDLAYAMEASESAIEELLPRNINYHGVSNIVKPLMGSFDNISLDNSVDFVIAFGAIHHSQCLFSTMKSISNCLKVGGYLIAQEPVMPNTTTNKEYIDKYNVIEEQFGMKIRNGDRDDHFFREAEYITAAAFAGLDLIFFDEYKNKYEKNNFREKVSVLVSFYKNNNAIQMVNKITNTVAIMLGFKKVTHLKDINPMAEYTKNVSPKLFVFKKADNKYIPHLWKKLK